VSEQPDTPAGTGSRVVAGKGRPTPKRSEAQKRRGGPVAPPPTTRKEAAQRMRAAQAEQRQQVRDGTRAGDDSRMLPRDAGPVRALVRDVVDGRHNTGVLLLPVALLSVLAQLTRVPSVVAVVTALFYATVLATVLDLVLTGGRVRSAVTSRFPEERVRGHVGYGLMRTMMFRRLRMPPARVRPAGLFRR